MKKLFTLAILSMLAWSLMAQQDDQFTQFMYYKQGLNPGAAGSLPGLAFTGIVRSQWLGFEGAPETQGLSFSLPVLNNRVGVGANIVRQTIGVTENFTLEGAYAYRIRVPRGHLSLGLMASVRLIRTDYTQVEGTQPISQDNAIPVGLQSKYVPNFGAGIYYEAPHFYLGASIPRLLTSNIDLADAAGTISREVPHFYLMGGVLLNVGDNVKIQPQVLFKYVSSAPFDADANINLIFADRVTTGVSYRLGGSSRSGVGESAAFLLGIQLSEKLNFGLSYDITMSELRRYNNGTVEGVIRYFVGGKQKEDAEVVTPRFF